MSADRDRGDHGIGAGVDNRDRVGTGIGHRSSGPIGREGDIERIAPNPYRGDDGTSCGIVGSLDQIASGAKNLPKLSIISHEYGKYEQNIEWMNAHNRSPLYMSPKLINGKVWIHVGSVFGGGYQKLPEDDPKYNEIFLWIDSQRFVELLDWVYNRRTPKTVI
jgi:hypothetical protein